MRLRAARAEELPDELLGLAVLALAEMRVAHAAALVDEVLRGPVLVRVVVPRLEAVVLHDGISDAEPLDGRAHVGGDVLERELRRVDPDDHETVLPVCRIPR